MHVCVVETDSMKCDICNREEAEWICVTCDNKMVCTDCDQKWHRHPKRLHHAREPLKSQQLNFSSLISSLTSPPGNFVRTKTMSETERIENASAMGNASLQKEFEQPEYVATNADVIMLSLSSDTNEMLRSEESVPSPQTDMNFLPKCVAEINEDLSYRSLLGVKDSFIPDHNSTGQIEHNYVPDTVSGSNSRNFRSLTSDFQSVLWSLQSKMDEVSSTVIGNGQIGSRDMDFGTEDWSLPQAVNKQTVASTSNSPACTEPPSTTVKNAESSQPVTRNADRKHHAADVDPEVARLLALTRYPPNMGASGSSEHSKHQASEQLSAPKKPQNTGQPVASNPSDMKSGAKEMPLTRASERTPIYMYPDGSDLPRARMQNTLPVENGLSDSSVHKDVLGSEHGRFTQSSQHKTQFAIDRQKSQTRIKERLTDSPGVVVARVGDGEGLGILARPTDGTGPAYHSKFTDIHDEVLLLLLIFDGTATVWVAPLRRTVSSSLLSISQYYPTGSLGRSPK